MNPTGRVCTANLLGDATSLAAMRDIDDLEREVLRLFSGYVGSQMVQMFRVSTDYRPLRQMAFEDGEYVVRREGLQLSRAVRELMSAQEGPARPACRHLGPRSWLLVCGMKVGRGNRSILLAHLHEPPSAEVLSLIGALASLAQNIANLISYAQADELTGLPNRKTFEETVNKVYELLTVPAEPYPDDRREGCSEQFWLAMIDIDNFKAINDNFGHLYGDEVLILIADLLRSSLRDDDLVYRFGGEEFVMIIRTTDNFGARVALERLREAVANHHFPQVGHVTVSIGAVKVDPDEFHVTLLDYADQALYQSKTNGRNQLTFFSDMVMDGTAELRREAGGSVNMF